MCKLCDQGQPQDHSTDHQTGDNTPETAAASRRGFLKTAGLAGAAGIGAAAGLLHASPATAQTSAPGAPAATGTPGRRYVIKGGAVLSMDSGIGDFAVGDVLVDGKKIVAVGPNIDAGGADVVEAGGMIIMPGFIDTHHHQFETALRSFLADGLLFNDGKPHGAVNYFDFILGKFAGVYRPQDVYINELFGSLSQLDAGVTTVHDISQIHHSPEHSDAAIKGIVDSGRRAAFGYFEGHGPKAKYPGDARRIKTQYFSSDDQLVTMIMGGEIYRPNYDAAWTIGRDLGIPVAAHIVGSLGMSKTFSKLIAEKKLGPDNLFIHMSAMPEDAWKATKDAGAGVSVASPIEMTMRHGMPPILNAMEHGIEPSLSTDVECTMTADFFTQMRSVMTLQRMLVNEMAIAKKENLPDLLITPTTAISPFPWEINALREINGETFDKYYTWMRISWGVSMSGHPAFSLPCGLDQNGMPFGIQVVGAYGRDAELAAMALALEKAMAGNLETARPMPDLSKLTQPTPALKSIVTDPPGAFT